MKAFARYSVYCQLKFVVVDVLQSFSITLSRARLIKLDLRPGGAKLGFQDCGAQFQFCGPRIPF